jgi:AraC-like DNA-binding protein
VPDRPALASRAAGYAPQMLLERLLDNLAVHVEPFARCDVANGCCLRLDELGWVTLHFVLRGAGELRVGRDATQPLRPGTLAVVPAHMAHSIRRGRGTEVTGVDGAVPHDAAGLSRFVATSGAEAGDANDPEGLVVACGELQVLFGPGLGLFDLLTEPVVVDLSDSEAMVATFRRMFEESEEPSPGSRAMLTALMNACLVDLFRRLCEGPDCALPWLEALHDPRMAAVLEVLLDQPERDHSLESLAAVATMSRSAFAERFRACFGRTPMAFVREVRLRRGAQLLRDTGMPIEAIAHRVGFASRSHFTRAFQQLFGTSPAAFRATT